MISIVNYGVGNLKSLQNAFKFLGFESELINSPEGVLRAAKVILPGVGAFSFAMHNIDELNLKEAMLEKARSGAPMLGICLGMQLFFSRSEERGQHEGFGLIDGQVLQMRSGLKVPHMGWNEINFKGESVLSKNLPTSRYGYFVHSFYCQPKNEDTVIATTEYGETFACAVESGNIFGLQFHPEKSQELGLQILRNFAEI